MASIPVRGAKALVTAVFVAAACAPPPSPTASGVRPSGTSFAPTSSATAQPTARPTVPVTEIEAPVLGRVALPSGEDHAPWEGQLAVAGGAIWIEQASRPVRLIRIDIATNRITSVHDLDAQVELLVDDTGGLWMVGPYGYAPGPSSFTLSRVDLATGAVHAVADLPSDRVAIGAGHVWASTVGGLLRFDLAGGGRTQVDPEIWGPLQVACGLVWGWDDLGLGPVLRRLDPADGTIVAYPGGGPIYIRPDGCWLFADDGFFRIWPSGDGPYAKLANVQFDGVGFWRSPPAFLERWDPMTGKFGGTRWVLDAQDTKVLTKSGLEGRLVAAGGSVWLVNAYEAVRFAISPG